MEKFYLNLKKNKNYFNAKIEEEINRLKEDLTPNKEEIIKRIENDTSFIIRKMLHNEKIRENIMKTPITYKPDDSQKMKLKRKNSLKLARTNYSGKNRKINIYAKDTKEAKEQNQLIMKKEKSELDINNNVKYDELNEYEYREMLNKKEHFYDILNKLENSIKESLKMYQRKIKDMNMMVEVSERKLTVKKNENELLKIEIDNLSKLLAITEEENKLMNESDNNKNPKKINNNNISKINNKNTIQTEQTEKELESQKEYLPAEYFQNENTKTNKEKTLMQTNSNTDVTRNEILNDLKALNSQNLEDPIQDSEIMRKNNNANKANNLAMKFPDLSNIEENVDADITNEEKRNKIIDDIKKKYNINGNNDNNDSNLDNKDYNNNKYYYEHENALDEKIEERNDNDENGENNEEFEQEDNNEN